MTADMVATHLPIKIIRGGSSKGIFARAQDLPMNAATRDRLLLRLFGSPDVRQIDGLGGGDKLTSKMAIMGPPTRPDCDISYLFAQVGTEFPDVDWASNCGNISSGAALFAAEARVGRIEGDRRLIAIEQTNTQRRLIASVPLMGGAPARIGNFSIGGVPGSGPRIDLDFADFAGSCLNRGLFPTGQRSEDLPLPDGTRLRVSIIDMANLNVIVPAAELGLDLTRPLDRLQADTALLDRLDDIRGTVMILLGAATPKMAPELIRRSVNPLVHIVGSPQDYLTLNSQNVAADSHDMIARSYARRAFSKAFPGTGAIGTAVAARINGTLAASYGGAEGTVRIGHPGGCLSVEVETADSGETPRIVRASIGRTARILLDGTAYLD